MLFRSTSTVLSAAFFAAISAVALVVSFMAASYLYARSTLIPYGVLLALSFILLELMIMVYFFVLSEFSSCLFGKKKDAPVLDQADIVQAAPAQLIDAQADSALLTRIKESDSTESPLRCRASVYSRP